MSQQNHKRSAEQPATDLTDHYIKDTTYDFNTVAYGRSVVTKGAKGMPEQPLRFALDHFVRDAVQGTLGARMKEYATKAFVLNDTTRTIYEEDKADEVQTKNLLRFSNGKNTIMTKSFNYAVNQVVRLEAEKKDLFMSYERERRNSASLREYSVNDILKHFGDEEFTPEEMENFLGTRALDQALVIEFMEMVFDRPGMEVV